jgi:hypothetical protein
MNTQIDVEEVNRLIRIKEKLSNYNSTLQVLLEIMKDIEKLEKPEGFVSIQDEYTLSSDMVNSDITNSQKHMNEADERLAKSCPHQMIKDTVDTWENGLVDVCYCNYCLLSDDYIFECKYKEEILLASGRGI